MTTSLSLPNEPSLTQPRVLPACFAITCWLLVNLPSTTAPGSFSRGLFSSRSWPVLVPGVVPHRHDGGLPFAEHHGTPAGPFLQGELPLTGSTG